MLQFTSTIVSEININPTQQEAFFEAFPAAPTDHEISVYMDLNWAFAGLPLPYARTDTNAEDIGVDSNDTNFMAAGSGTPGQIVEKYGNQLKDAAYMTLVSRVKRHWDNFANLAPADQNNFHYEQVRYALEHLFDGGDNNALVADTNDTNSGGVTYISNLKVAQWVRGYDKDVDKNNYTTGVADVKYFTMPKLNQDGSLFVVDTNTEKFYDSNTIPEKITPNYLISSDTNNSYGDAVFNRTQINELLEAASDAGKFNMRQYSDGTNWINYRALDLEDGESFAVRVKVIQRHGNLTQNPETNVAHWLVKIVQRSSNAVNDPKYPGGKPLHILGLLAATGKTADSNDLNFMSNLMTVNEDYDTNGTVAPHDDTNFMGNNIDQDTDTNANDTNT